MVGRFGRGRGVFGELDVGLRGEVWIKRLVFYSEG